MNSTAKNALIGSVISAAVGLASAGVYGLVSLAFKVNTLVIEKSSLERRIEKLEKQNEYLHGHIEP